MDKPMKTSQKGVALIKRFEGCHLEAYLCPASVWTIGYGHTCDVTDADVIDEEGAEAFLIEDLEEFEGYVNDLVEVDLTQNQFDALVAWTFNLGPGALKESTLLRKLNEGDFGDIPHQIRRWNRAGGQVLNGLVRRREAEALLFRGEPWENV